MLQLASFFIYVVCEALLALGVWCTSVVLPLPQIMDAAIVATNYPERADGNQFKPATFISARTGAGGHGAPEQANLESAVIESF